MFRLIAPLTTFQMKSFQQKHRLIQYVYSRKVNTHRINSSINYKYGYLSKRSATSVALKSIDDLPGDFDALPQELIKSIVDGDNFWDEKYQIAKQYDPKSPMIKYNFGGTCSVILFSHDLVKQWQQYELGGKIKRVAPEFFVKLFGKFAKDGYGQKHLKWRKKAALSFKPNIIDQYTPFIQESAQNIVLENIYNESQRNGEAVNFCPLAKEFAFEVASKFMFGPMLDQQERSKCLEMFQRFIKGITPEAFEDLEAKDPNSVLSKAYKAKEELNAFLKPKYIEAEKLTKNNEWDEKYENSHCVLRGLIENDGIFDNDGQYGLEDKIDFLMILTFAAYDTSATSLTNLIYTMWKHPEQTKILRDAILKHPQLSDTNTVFTMEMLKECNELNCFIDEFNRKYGIAPFLIRNVGDDKGLEFGEYNLAKDTGILIPIKWLHQGEGSWTDSMEFKPSRFDKSNGENKADRGDIGRYNNIPFATGLHKCLGMHLALLEMKIYTVLLLRDWQFEIDESKLTEQDGVVVNDMNIQNGIPHFNVYLKLKKMQKQTVSV